MAASKTTLHLMCFLLWGEVRFAQLSVVELDVGDTVTLNCFVQGHFKLYYWYKHSFGDKPEPLAFRSKYSNEATMSEKFNNSRFSVVTGKHGENHLKISDVQMSDSATYYCGMWRLFEIQFLEGLTLHVRGSSSSIQAIVQQPPEKKAGDSVTLNCTVHTAGAYHCAVASNNRPHDEEGDCRHQMKVLVFLSVGRTGVVLCLVLVCTVVYMARKYTCYVEER